MHQTARYRLLALCVLLLAPALLWAATYYVKPDGNDRNEGGTPAGAFKTLTHAVQMFNHGDSIVLAPGVYHENVLLAERFAANGAEQAITGDESGKLTGSKPGPVYLEAADAAKPTLHAYRVVRLQLNGLTFRGAGQGLRLEKCRDCAINRCTFDGLTRGVVLVGDSDTRVASCVLARNTLGITVQGSAGTTIAHCTVAGASTAGLLMLSAGPGSIEHCLLVANNTNYITDATSAVVWHSDYNALTGCCGPWGDASAVANIYEWFARSGQERHSVYVVPEFADPAAGDLHLSPRVSWAGGLPGMGLAVNSESLPLFDRDGNRLPAGNAGAYAYPAPVTAPGWQKLAVKLEPKDGVRQSAAIYRPDGTLLRTLLADAAGVSALYWDGLDDQGQPVPAGAYQLRAVAHDVSLLDDGAFGNSGNPLGAYDTCQVDRVAALPDGGFVATALYDESGFPLRVFSSTGQPTFANNLLDKNFSSLVLAGAELYATVGLLAGNCGIQRFQLPGERLHMANGAEAYPILSKAEAASVAAEQKAAADYQAAYRNYVQQLLWHNLTTKDEPAKPALKHYALGGMAVIGNTAFVSLAGFDVVRVFDLANGQKKADWPLASPADITADPRGALWVLSGKELLQLDPATGAVMTKYATGLEAPNFLAADSTRFAVVDSAHERIAMLNAATGAAIRILGQARPAGEWLPCGGNLHFSSPRGCAFLPDGKLVVTQAGSICTLWADEGKLCQQLGSDFMDVAIPHPQQPEYVYLLNMSVAHVDPGTGAWHYLAEGPSGLARKNEELSKLTGKDEWSSYSYGYPSTSVVLGGKPFIAACSPDGYMYLFDVSDPVKPRLALSSNERVLRCQVSYDTLSFTRGGDIITNASRPPGKEQLGGVTAFNRIPFLGLDAQGNPKFDFAHPVRLGPDDDPVAGRGMKCKNEVSSDKQTGDIYYLATSNAFCKMVPMWGQCATGVGRSSPEGKPLWFALSSGGNYEAGAVINDGHNAWYLAGKAFGGQIDLFDADGLRLTTGNWGWPCHYGIGFVDMPYAVSPYLRADGKVGAYVEDDNIGRLARVRVDGADTVRRVTKSFDWKTPAAAAAPATALPDAQQTQGTSLQTTLAIPRVEELPVNGDWEAWTKAGVQPQIVALPIPGWKRSFPDDLWQTFRAGTGIGALAHDDKYLYAYFLIADDTPVFGDNPAIMFCYNGIEFWVEEEQFGLGLLGNGKPALFKYRFHNRDGSMYGANYALADDNVWGAKLDNLGAHPLGRQLADITGVSFQGKTGYALMARIPFNEIKLVGGMTGRGGNDILPSTGKPGEILRIGVAISAISAWGREQDYKVYWPAGLMFSDPTRSVLFEMK